MAGVDLMRNPEQALNPYIAAKILALYFKTHHIVEAAQAEDWRRVRLLVNGGLNNYARFLSIVQRLLMTT